MDTLLKIYAASVYFFYMIFVVRILCAHFLYNHPGYKLIFFVFDESSMYCKVNEKNKVVTPGERFVGTPHKWCVDRAFVEVFKDSGIDFFIWFTPYKYLNVVGQPSNIPTACFYDCNKISETLIEYDSDYMMSVEE